MLRDELLTVFSSAIGFPKRVLGGEFDEFPIGDTDLVITFMARFIVKRHGLSLPPEIQARYFLRKARNYRRYARRMRRVYPAWRSGPSQ